MTVSGGTGHVFRSAFHIILVFPIIRGRACLVSQRGESPAALQSYSSLQLLGTLPLPLCKSITFLALLPLAPSISNV